MAVRSDIVPRCDEHPDAAMVARQGVATDVLSGERNTVTVWFCTRDGCLRSFHESHGYQNVGTAALERGTPLSNHGEFMIVQPTDNGGQFVYICPLEGCREALPYPLSALHTALNEPPGGRRTSLG